MNVFYVRDASGKPVDMKTIEALRKEIGHTMMLNVKKESSSAKTPEASGWAKKPKEKKILIMNPMVILPIPQFIIMIQFMWKNIPVIVSCVKL